MRRAVLLREDATEPDEIDRLTPGLHVVYTIYLAIGSVHAPMVATQHVLDLDAEVLIVPHLTSAQVRSVARWQPVAELVDIVTATGVIGLSPH